jgi:hypothetical protein
MPDKANAQTPNRREIVESLDREFARLHLNCCHLIERTSAELLYRPGGNAHALLAENILRAAAAVERTFGGITSNLWDDPFEWTLPEQLSTSAKVIQHLKEVEELRRHAFASFSDDQCLLKQVAVPSGDVRPLIGLLLETLVTAVAHHSQALVIWKQSFGD